LPDAVQTATFLTLGAIKPTDTVLHRGTMSGWSTAVARELGSSVTATERSLFFLEMAARSFNRARREIRVVHTDGYVGVGATKPFDVILVSQAVLEERTNAAKEILWQLLSPVGGRLVLMHESGRRASVTVVGRKGTEVGEWSTPWPDWRPLLPGIQTAVPTIEDLTREAYSSGGYWNYRLHPYNPALPPRE
jgi:protein-L-isoaspartate O-methyltransferase